MPVRVATFADLQPIARVLAAAFYNEELNAYFFPDREHHPEDYVQAWYQVVLKKWAVSNNLWIVNYISTDNNGSGHGSIDDQAIVGAAQWERGDVKSGQLASLNDYINPAKYLAPAVSCYLHLHRLLFRNRSMVQSSPNDPQPLNKWDFGNIIWPFCEQYYDLPVASRGRWQLDVLGVHPEHQKHGHASKLIAWGLSKAKEQNLPAVVLMAKGLEEFYKRQGFEILVGYATTEDLVTEEKSRDGRMVKKTIPNPLKQRNIGGGGIAWTYTHVHDS